MWSSNFAGFDLTLLRFCRPFFLALLVLCAVVACGGNAPPVAATTTAMPTTSAPPSPPSPPSPSPSPSQRAAPRRPEPPPIDATTLVYDHARIVATIDLVEARALGLEAALGRLAPFRAGAVTASALADASWVVVATPSLQPNPRSSFVFRAGASAAAIRDRVEAAIAEDPRARIETQPARPGSLVAAHLPIDGSPHAVLVRDDGIVAVVPEAEIDRVLPRLARAKVAVELAGDVARATVLRPSTMLAEIPESAFAARARVLRAPGTADLHLIAELDCPIEQEAIVGAHAIERAIDKSAAWAGRARASARGTVIAFDAAASPAMIDAIFR